MRVNIYAEEMTDRLEIIAKDIDGHRFTGLRFYLELPATIPYPKDGTGETSGSRSMEMRNVSGPFIHREGDDDSAAVTFWGKRDLRNLLRKALAMLDDHYGVIPIEPAHPDTVQVPREPTREMLKAGDSVASSVAGGPFMQIQYPAGVGPEDVYRAMLSAYEKEKQK